jgi:hypothetical protein
VRTPSALVALVVSAPLALLGACCSTDRPDDPNVAGDDPTVQPPVVGVVASDLANKAIGDNASVTWESDRPVVWTVVDRPAGWTVASQSETRIRLAGRMPPGSSERAIEARVRASIDGSDVSATTDPTTARARPLVFNALTIGEPADLGLTTVYPVAFNAPAWPEGAQASVIITADARGLSAPGGGWNPDSITIVGPDDRADAEVRLVTPGTCTTPNNNSVGRANAENERTVITGDRARRIFATGAFFVMITDHPAPDADEGGVDCGAVELLHVDLVIR